MSDVASLPRPIPSLPLTGTINGRDAGSDSTICRAEIDTGTKPLTWLAGRAEDELLYWASRDGEDETAAAGVLVKVSGSAASGTAPWMERIEAHLLTAAAGVRFYGGTRFDSSSPAAPEWQELGGYRFVVPRFEAVTRDGSTLLACNFFPPERNRLPELLADLLRVPPPSPTQSPPVRLRRHADAPNRSTWETLIQTALKTIDNPADPLNKVVMARCTEATAASPITPQALLGAMSRTNDRSFRFLIQTCPKTAFISVTPERLFSLNGRTVQTEAIAGTRPRGATLEDDRHLQQELSTSVKDRLEHRIVHDSIAAALSGLCTETKASEVTVLCLPAVQHLMSQFSGELAAGLSVADLVDALHPTPAVGGDPTAAACRFLTDHEPFDRGWYAAPVGWVGQGEATFAVAIRSALIDDGVISFYTGNGVVTGSSPDEEWSELEAKIGCHFEPAG